MATQTSAGVRIRMPSRRKAILCLCHDATMLRVRKMLLEHEGYEVMPSRSAARATKIAAATCPDMVIMDNSYPGRDAESLATQLKQACPETIAVVLSPYFAVRDASHSAVDCFLANDGPPDHIVARIGELFAEHAR
jgi:CheY-like chemotaxis protein